VARNIAAVLALLELRSGRPPPLLVSCVGDDSAGAALLSSLAAAGLPARGVRVAPGGRTATVAAVFAGSGDIAAAIADCGLLESALTPLWLSRFAPELAAAPAVLLDMNASADALRSAAGLGCGRLWLEPVSVAKAARAAPLLRAAAFVSPNAAELQALARALGGPQAAAPAGGGARAALAALRPCIQTVLAAGCAHVVTTLGADGALMSWLERGAARHLHLPAPPVAVISASGAGDALVAGALAALCRGEAAAAAVAAGVAAAAVVVGRAENAPPAEAWPPPAELAAAAAAVLAAAEELA